MTPTPRRVSRAALLLIALLATPAVSLAQGDFAVMAHEPSVTGSFLAGQRALSDLQTSQAVSYFRDALAADYENPYVVESAYIALASDGQVDLAAKTARHLLELTGSGDLARLVVAADDLANSRFEETISGSEQIGEGSFIGIAGRIIAAWAHLGAGRYTEAVEIFDKLGEDGLADFLVLHRGLLADVAGRAVEAEQFARTAYENDKLVPRIIEAYTRILGNAGRYDEALKVLNAYRDEGYSHAVLTPVREAVEARTPPGAFAGSVQAGAAEMLHSIGVALAREGGRETAMVFLQLGRYLDPRSDAIALVLGQIYDVAENHAAANRIYDRVPATSPLKPTAVIRAAENFDSLGNRAEAIRRLSNIVVANPDNIDALSVLGDLQRTDEQYAEAAKTYTEVLRIAGGNRPGDWRYYYVRGIAYERNKEWEKAEPDFKRALELNPTQPQVLNYLGYSWVDMGRNLEPALEMIEKAVAAAPNDGYIIDSLGWAFYRLGRYDEAVVELEKAVRLRSDDPEINDHLGDAYWMAGRKQEARFQWAITVSVDKDGGAAKERASAKLAAEKPDLGVDAVAVADEDDTASEPTTAAETVEPVAAPQAAPASEPASPIPAEPAADEPAPSTPAEQPAVEAPAPAPAAPEAAPVEPVAPKTEEAAPVAQPAASVAVEPRTVTVERGDNLWEIAREVYGDGSAFRMLLDANSDRISNPDLIQPGLVLVVPEKP